MVSDPADDPVEHFRQRVSAAPVLVLLDAAAPGGVCFRYRSEQAVRGDAPLSNTCLSNALRAAGYTMVSEALVDGRPALCCSFEAGVAPERVDALVHAAIVLGAVTAAGQSLPEGVVANLRPDGLPAYIGFAGLWRLELSGIEISRLGPLLEARVARDPDDAAAMMDMATLLILTLIPGNRGPAFAMQARALERQSLYRLPAKRVGEGLRVLAFAGPGDMTALTHLDCLLEDADVELLMLYARPDRPLPDTLPDHDVIFVAIGESGPNRLLLEQVEVYMRDRAGRVLNPPARILELSRDRVSDLLRGIEGVEMPSTVRVERAEMKRVVGGEVQIEQILGDGGFPLIVRPVDSQGGKDLVRLADRQALGEYLETAVYEAYFASRFVDYSAEDGQFRKYRVVLVEGRPYACHMAVSTHWMIHYVNADMDQSADKRVEEADFMSGFDTGFGARHALSLARIDRALGLDYYGIDCAETSDGKLLVFEADTAMLVHAMDSTDLYPYKRPQMEKLFAAFRAMLGNAVRSNAAGRQG